MICEPALRESVQSLPDALLRMAGYHFGWWNPEGIPCRAGSGKALRPALTLGTAAMYGAEPAAIAPVAAAIELVHNFALIHDDVIDGDPTRRGRPTVWAVWDVPAAVLLGDALHALAVRVLAAHVPAGEAREAIDRLESAVIEMCRGQQEDCSFDGRHPTSVLDYERMAMGKTGALLGCACALGALRAGAGATAVSAMDRFGRELGMAFQYTDDLIGIWGDPGVSGKPSSDLARRKKSMPVVTALHSNAPAARELDGFYRAEAPMSQADIARAAVLVDAMGGRRTTQHHADRRIAAALAALPDRPAATDLITLAHNITHRDR
ncbi:polyprenyl synthetase family protein [Nocardia sp. NBC_01503]|uniref:polyprenyl synthetase family protein n=1 Tax=Nocardia sp. NBC_01503 TaxID=2975997 RepID=UPI002E7B8760|nr:polyprenyl synthetase family protein [Nocardia sp. NBC_01503]WTL36391.1 polyprenyl synthetase family protein [Nocardia sp. NBC_01503]